MNQKDRQGEDRADDPGAAGAPAPASHEGEDAPTSAEENEGMSTVLSADLLSGVQKDAGED